jgi:hypothetical protein
MAHVSSDSKEVAAQSAIERYDDEGAREDYNHVEAKYLGSTVDQREMHALGRIQQLRVCHQKDKSGMQCLTDPLFEREISNTYLCWDLAAP